MDFSFAVRRSDPALYYILNKTSSLVPTASLNAALTEYSSSGINVSFGEFLRQHIYVVIFGGLAVAIAAVLFIFRRAEEKEKMLKEQLEQMKKDTPKILAAATGTMVGHIAGAAIGTAIGSLIGPGGAILGAKIGAVIGEAVGSVVAGIIYDHWDDIKDYGSNLVNKAKNKISNTWHSIFG